MRRLKHKASWSGICSALAEVIKENDYPVGIRVVGCCSHGETVYPLHPRPRRDKSYRVPYGAAVSLRTRPELHGGTGVSIFFFLSGFLITTLLRRERDKTGSISLLNFYVRRAFRILPPLYITIAIGIFASRAGLIGGHAGLVSTACATLFGGNYYMLSPTHNWPDGFSVMWSLAVEEHFYLLFPLLYLAIVSWSRGKPVTLLAGLCAIALGWRIFLVFLQHDERRIYLCTDTRFDSILFGCIFAIAFNPTMDKLPRLLKNPYFALAGLLSVLGWEHMPLAKGTIAYTLTAASLIPVFSYVITNAKSASVRWLDSRILRQNRYMVLLALSLP